MKAKLFLGLAVCCFLVSLGLMVGLAIKGVQAQSTPGPWPQQPLFVKFAEDFMRQHGRQVQSYNVYTGDGNHHFVVTTPQDRRFIVTDICVQDASQVHINTGPGGSGTLEKTVLTIQVGYYVNLNSGITCEPNRDIMLYAPGSTYTTISGYYVDNP